MSSIPGQIPGVVVPIFEENRELAKPGWNLETARRRLVEISGSAGLAAAAVLCAAAQAAGDSAAWVMTQSASFFPPDMAAAGVDLESLAVVRVASQSQKLARAATILAHSGGFGVIVIDFGDASDIANPTLSMAAQGRLHRLAIAHDAAIACVTDKPADTPSLGSMVSLRIHTEVIHNHFDNHLRVTLHALKDKRRGPGWSVAELFHGPPGAMPNRRQPARPRVF